MRCCRRCCFWVRIGKANVSASSLIDAHTARLHRALSCAVFDATSWRAPRSGGRRTPRDLIPLGSPQRANDAALPLRSCLREGEHIQLLRWCLEVQAPTRKYHAINESKSFCPLLRSPVRTKFKQKRDSKNFCQQQTHLRGGIYAPQMEEFCHTNNPTAAV